MKQGRFAAIIGKGQPEESIGVSETVALVLKAKELVHRFMTDETAYNATAAECLQNFEIPLNSLDRASVRRLQKSPRAKIRGRSTMLKSQRIDLTQTTFPPDAFVVMNCEHTPGLEDWQVNNRGIAVVGQAG